MKESKCGNFAVKLNSLLNNSRYSSIIRWSDSKTAIQILDELKMEREVLPVYFRQTKFESFVRQLNLYGFKKIKSHQISKFVHPLLQEGFQMTSISTVKVNKSKIVETTQQDKQSEKKKEVTEKIEIVQRQLIEANHENSIKNSVENRSSTFQVDIPPTLVETFSVNPSSCFPSIVYFTINPYIGWNYTQIFNNNFSTISSHEMQNEKNIQSN